MRRFIMIAATAMMVATLAVGTVAGAGNLWKAPPFSSIGIKTVEIEEEFIAPRDDGKGELSAWMETGSSRTACLATLNEAHWDVFTPTVFCAPRMTADGRWGIWLHIFVAGPLAAGQTDFYYMVNVYQEGARYYGDPEYFTY